MFAGLFNQVLRMRSREDLLKELNAELPPLDWRKGAQDYLAGYFERYSRPQIEDFVFTKPLAAVTPEDPVGALTETVSYLFNFASSMQLLALPRGARVLDVACGGGWFSHWMRKLGYEAIGMDLSADFVDLARRRLKLDPHLDCSSEAADAAYRVHDFEAERLPDEFRGTFDAVVLESCLHHFFDPIAALSHIAEGLKPDGVALIIEAENRTGPIKPEYMQVMVETATLERPYPRELLVEVAAHAELPHIEFVGTTPGFFAQSSRLSSHMTEHLANSMNGSNFCVAAKSAEALRRVVPTYGEAQIEPVPPAQTTPASIPVEMDLAKRSQPSPDRFAQGVRDNAPGWLRPVLRAGWRTVRPLLR